MSSKPLVSVVKVKDDDVDGAINESIELIGGLEEVREKTAVAIKPNLCCLKGPYSGATTDPRVVEAVVKKIRAISSCEINIVESDNSHASADETFKKLGYTDLEREYAGVRCINLSKDSKVRLTLKGKILSSILVPETMIFSDYIINIAKLKTHVDHRYTGALKNTYGFLLSSNRAQYHGFMKKILVDLNALYRPDLVIIDGIVGMEGFGPTDGTPRKVGVIIASRDPIAADAVGARVIGVNPDSVGYLKYAAKQGIGSMIDMEVLGSDLKGVETVFQFIPSSLYNLERLSLWLQRSSRYIGNFARFLSLVRSSLSAVGFSTMKERFSYSEMIGLATDTFLRVDA